MKSITWRVARRLGTAAAVLGLVSGCGDTKSSASSAAAADSTPPAPEDTTPPQLFATPESASAALIAAAEKFDVPALKAILGGQGADLVESRDTVQDRLTATAFAAQAREKRRLQLDSTKTTAVLSIGPGDWPMPIPIVQHDGRWYFDAAAGREEVLRRRIGRNELAAIRACRTYVYAQKVYASRGHDSKPKGLYATALRSDPGRHNGLYWPATHGQARSPLGDLIADAAGESSFQGYHFKILAPREPNGFALVAWPATYDRTGVMTFVVNQDGVVREKDLGSDTAQVAGTMTAYNPDDTWNSVK